MFFGSISYFLTRPLIFLSLDPFLFLLVELYPAFFELDVVVWIIIIGISLLALIGKLILVIIPHLYFFHRRLEFWADNFAVEKTSKEAVKNMLKKSDTWMEHRKNNRIYNWLLDLSHPSIKERIDKIDEKNNQ